jgi:hypothetical protein
MEIKFLQQGVQIAQHTVRDGSEPLNLFIGGR